MSTNPAHIEVIQSLPKAVDLETHVRIVEIEGIRVLEFRDYITSLGEYGRGYWVPLNTDTVFGMVNALNEVVRREGI
jgi:hypothetical protein